MKKFIYGFALVGMLAFGIIFGTFSKYHFETSSPVNHVNAAKFVINTNLNASRTFTIDSAYPGMPTQYYSFYLQNKAELPVKYTINLLTGGDLFQYPNSPVTATLQRLEDGAWVNVTSTYLIDQAQGDDFAYESYHNYRVAISWPLETAGFNDTVLQGLQGTFQVTVNCEQADMTNVANHHNVVYGDVNFKYVANSTTYRSNTTGGWELTTIEYFKDTDNVRHLVIHGQTTDVNLIETGAGTNTYSFTGASQYAAVLQYQANVNNQFGLVNIQGNSFVYFDNLPTDLMTWLGF